MNIQQLQKELETLEQRIKKIKTAISALQDVCTHTHPSGQSALVDNGHDSHYRYSVCSLCGKEFSN